MNKDYILTNSNKVAISDEYGIVTERKHTTKTEEILIAENDLEQAKKEKKRFQDLIVFSKNKNERLKSGHKKDILKIILTTGLFATILFAIAQTPQVLIAAGVAGLSFIAVDGAITKIVTRENRKRINGFTAQIEHIDKYIKRTIEKIKDLEASAKEARFDLEKSVRSQKLPQTSPDFKQEMACLQAEFNSGYKKPLSKPKVLSLQKRNKTIQK